MRPRPWLGTVLLTGFAAVLSACGDPGEPVVGEATPEPMHDVVDQRCEDPDDALVELVAERLDVSAELTHPKVVASQDGEDLRFFAAEVAGGELDAVPPVGAWALIGDAEDPQIYSVNAVARSHSGWPDGTRSAHDLTMKTDGGEEAKTCVEGETP